MDVVKFLLEYTEDFLKEVTLSGELPLHIACRAGKCSVINCILEKVSLRNKDDKLPLELLLCADVDRDSFDYVEAINRLLRSHSGVLECLNGGDLLVDDIKRSFISFNQKEA